MTILNEADNVMSGGQQVEAIYAGTVEVWSDQMKETWAPAWKEIGEVWRAKNGDTASWNGKTWDKVKPATGLNMAEFLGNVKWLINPHEHYLNQGTITTANIPNRGNMWGSNGYVNPEDDPRLAPGAYVNCAYYVKQLSGGTIHLDRHTQEKADDGQFKTVTELTDTGGVGTSQQFTVAWYSDNVKQDEYWGTTSLFDIGPMLTETSADNGLRIELYTSASAFTAYAYGGTAALGQAAYGSSIRSLMSRGWFCVVGSAFPYKKLSIYYATRDVPGGESYNPDILPTEWTELAKMSTGSGWATFFPSVTQKAGLSAMDGPPPTNFQRQVFSPTANDDGTTASLTPDLSDVRLDFGGTTYKDLGQTGVNGTYVFPSNVGPDMEASGVVLPYVNNAKRSVNVLPRGRGAMMVENSGGTSSGSHYANTSPSITWSPSSLTTEDVMMWVTFTPTPQKSSGSCFVRGTNWFSLTKTSTYGTYVMDNMDPGGNRGELVTFVIPDADVALPKGPYVALFTYDRNDNDKFWYEMYDPDGVPLVGSNSGIQQGDPVGTETSMTTFLNYNPEFVHDYGAHWADGLVADNLATPAQRAAFVQTLQLPNNPGKAPLDTPWASATAYVPGDRVSDEGRNYVCYAAHTASSSNGPGSNAATKTSYWRFGKQPGSV